jgi:hypothetical protein
VGLPRLSRDDATIDWLLEPADPAVRHLALTDLLDRPASDPEVRRARQAIAKDRHVLDLLGSEHPDGQGVAGGYQKFRGAHWRLVSAVELGVPGGDPTALAMLDPVLDFYVSERHRKRIPTIEGRVRRCASQEGNVLAVACRLGIADDPRAQLLARSLVEWQWPDGGWNCDVNPAARHSSFNESLIPIWGLVEYHRATGEPGARAAAGRAAELLLRHRMFRSDHTGEVIDPVWLRLRYPAYWRYDVLHGLLVLSRLGPLTDSRLEEALDLVAGKRRKDGRWWPEGYHWRRPGLSGSGVEITDWGRREPSKMITLNALRVLKAAGRLAAG